MASTNILHNFFPKKQFTVQVLVPGKAVFSELNKQ
jgi:hypothetical protein